MLLKSRSLKISKNVDFDESANDPTITCAMINRYPTFGNLRLELKYVAYSDGCTLQVSDADAGEPVASSTENNKVHNDGSVSVVCLDEDGDSHDNIGDDRENLLGALTF